jgi:multiple sugar transport system permease protein
MRPKASPLEASQQRFGFLLTLPALLAFAVLILGPFARSLWLAFHEYLLTSATPVTCQDSQKPAS